MSQSNRSRNVKLAYMFTAPNSVAAYERLRFCSCITVAINPNSKVLEAAKRKIHAGPNGITIGAVSYPYLKQGGAPGEIDKVLGLHEVSAVKTASLTFKCRIDEDGKISPLTYDPSNRMFKDIHGNYIPAWQVVHKHFNSALLNAQRNLIAQGKPPTIHQDYLRWLEKMSTKKRVIDVANKVGEEMVDVTQEVYFGGMTPSDQIHWPDIYLRTHQVVSLKDNAIEDYIFRAAQFEEGSFSIEFAPHQGVVTRVEKNEADGVYYVDITRVSNEASSNGQRLYRLTDKVTTVDIPFCGFTNILVTPNTELNAGEIVTSDEVISKTTRIADLIGFHPGLTNLDEITTQMTEQFWRKLSKFAVEANQTMINNVPATSIAFLKELPPGVDWKNDVYMRNTKTRGLYYGSVDKLRGELNEFMSYDLVHHSFYDFIPGSFNHNQKNTDVVYDNSVNFGDGLNIQQQAEEPATEVG